MMCLLVSMPLLWKVGLWLAQVAPRRSYKSGTRKRTINTEHTNCKLENGSNCRDHKNILLLLLQKIFHPKEKSVKFFIQKFPGGISSLKLDMSNKQVDETEGLSSTLVCVKCDSRRILSYLIFFGEDFNLQNLALKSGLSQTCQCLYYLSLPASYFRFLPKIVSCEKLRLMSSLIFLVLSFCKVKWKSSYLSTQFFVKT